MGLLEDAIREHLELKRRRGADAEEVAAEEKDALGPPGRPTPLEDAAAQSAGVESVPPPAAEDDAGMFFDAEADAGPDPEDGLYEDAAVDEIFQDEEPAVAEEPGHVEEAPATEHTIFTEEPVAAEPSPPPPPPPVAPEPPAPEDLQSAEHEPDEVPVDDALDQPTRIQPLPPQPPEPPEPPPPAPAAEEPVDEDEAALEEEEGPSEDMLEETPEFLQETPEHDRLWFEQKPPRDFDFGN